MINETTFLKRLKGVTLSDNERLQMRERLLAYADLHEYEDESVSYAPSFFAIFSSRRFSLYTALMVIVLVSGSGISLAAEGSTPGDTLYPIKIHVNEPVMIALTPTNEGQARVAARLATRRADEVVTLAIQGKLTKEHSAYLARAFESQIHKAAKRADFLTTSGNAAGAATVRADLAATLAGEAQALGAIQATGNGQEEDARHFLAVIVATSEGIDTLVDTEGFSTRTQGIDRNSEDDSSAGATAAGLPKKASIHPEVNAKEKQGSRFARGLYLQASTTLQGRLETTRRTILTPKVDSAVQKQSSEPEHSFSELEKED